MTLTAGFSTEEIRAYVTEYNMIPFGQKGQWVALGNLSRRPSSTGGCGP